MATMTRRRKSALDGLISGEASGQAGAGTTVPSKTASKPSRQLYPTGTGADSRDTVAPDESITTTRRTAAQNADVAAFDKNVLPGLSERNYQPTEAEVAKGATRPTISSSGPSAQQILDSRAARLAKDPYDLAYEDKVPGFNAPGKATASGWRGDMGSASPSTPASAPASQSMPTARPSGMAVSAVVNTSALESAGSRVAGPSTPAAPSTPLGEVAAFTPPPGQVNPYTQPALPRPPSPTPGPTAAPSTNPTPGVTPTPEATPAPTATPTATPNPVVTPGRALASGVSNSQAAGFSQPTQEKPVPETPTSPALDIEDYDKKRGKMFGGF